MARVGSGFDRDGLGLHVTIKDGTINKLTLMSLALMPPHLR
jgi:hypothetical protein